MIQNRAQLFSILTAVILLLSLTTNLYYQLSIALLVVILVATLDKFGKGIVLRELIAMHTTLVCLVMPVLGYTVYNRQDYLASLLRRYMRVPEEMYFSFALPAVTVFVLALCWPLGRFGKQPDEGAYFQNTLASIRRHLTVHYKKGFILIGIGVTASLVMNSVPSELGFFIALFYYASFAGLLYLFFSPAFPGKITTMVLFVAFLVSSSLSSGMFTVVAYMGVTIISFLFAGKRFPLPVKIGVFVSGLMLLVVVQNVKMVYRTYIWNKTYAGDKTSLFTSLFIENLQKGERLFDRRAFFPVHMRVNQGFNVSLVMNRIPAVKPHDGGRALSLSLASAAVPRLLWPNKPEAGGKANMLYYAGWRLKGWSTNVGPLGEAYGAFGATGGIFYMFILGFFIRWVYARMFRTGEGIPLLILWIPVLFYQTTYSAETDTLQILNSLVKTAFFIWLLYKISPQLFGVGKRGEAVRYRPTVQAA